MTDLRLVDRDGYTVPGTIHLNTPDADLATVRAHLAATAALHPGWRVQETPRQPVHGTFLHWLAQQPVRPLPQAA
ncbi:hypothetical protein [Streptomyces olivaceiscleroticus]|uniref:Uncharacterized protein n=1 Tax=Streptomyces olivaceiscleroticus TaxID=68245 RepID=A0ABN1BM33_9ACTN